jgi:hypothetical protein
MGEVESSIRWEAGKEGCPAQDERCSQGQNRDIRQSTLGQSEGRREKFALIQIISIRGEAP